MRSSLRSHADSAKEYLPGDGERTTCIGMSGRSTPPDSRGCTFVGSARSRTSEVTLCGLTNGRNTERYTAHLPQGGSRCCGVDQLRCAGRILSNPVEGLLLVHISKHDAGFLVLIVLCTHSVASESGLSFGACPLFLSGSLY